MIGEIAHDEVDFYFAKKVLEPAVPHNEVNFVFASFVVMGVRQVGKVMGISNIKTVTGITDR